MNEYDIFHSDYCNDFGISSSCLNVFENIDFIHKSNNILMGASYSRYCFPHKKAFMSISYEFEGTTVYTVNDKEYVVRPGEFIIYGRGCVTSQTTDETGSVTYTLAANPEFCKNHNITDDIVCHIKNDDTLTELFINLVRSCDTNDNVPESTLVCIKLLEYINKTYSSYSVGFDDSCTFSDKQMTKVLTFINRNLFNKITLEDMAAVLGYHPIYFTRVFKKTCGYSPVNYANFMRCRAARQLLLTTDFAPDEIMEMCGFYSMRQFKDMYKKLIGRDALADAKIPAVVIEIK
ncbi:MAG: helix-turn-helix transcriptional regulator [Clostridia bacterium]|nr:helix-turn-helix transcriptional regulator [Clostridia bacterium]